jgi:RNA-directed DNA polymerase
LEGDVKGCFDNIRHEWLLDNIPMNKAILKQFLKAGYKYNRHLKPTKTGTPQGAIISPLLANMTLDVIKMAIASRFHVNKNGKIEKRRCNPHKVNFVRYADDFFTERNRLKLFSDTKIVRPTSLKLDKNPFLDS